jgi:hypothetical protein
MLIKLTKLESDILRHRLEVPDAIADALADEGYRPDFIWGAAEYILNGITRHGLDLSRELLQEPLCRDILQDCIEGSTYCGSMIEVGAESRQVEQAKYRAAVRAMESLAEKIGAAIDRKLTGVYA